MEEEEKKEAPEEVKKAEEEVPKDKIVSKDETKTTPLIDIANAAAERMEKANEETAKLLKRMEELEQRKALGGGSPAGDRLEKKEETPKEYSERIMRGDLNKDERIRGES